MNIQEEGKFWAFTQYLLVERNYEMIQISEDQNEIWFKNDKEKNAPIIRILLHNLDWGNWLKRDIQQTLMKAENLRNYFKQKKWPVLNIYFSAHPPVDDYEDSLNRGLALNKGKTIIYSALIDRSNTQNGIEKLDKILHVNLRDTIYVPHQEEEVKRQKESIFHYVSNTRQKQKSVIDKPIVTYLFLVIQIAMFLILELTGGSNNSINLIRFGAKFNPAIIDGEWWRFFTPMFLHIGMLHLIMNSLALYFTGPLIERLYGSSRFAIIYIISGFLGSLISFAFSPSLSAGASGAIFGLFGSLLYIGANYPKYFFRTMGTNVIMVIVINLVFGFTTSGIDNYGHVGGLVGGFLASAVLHFPKQKRYHYQIPACLILVIITLFLLYVGYNQ